MLPEPATIFERDHDHLLAGWRDAMFVVWRRDTTLAAAHDMGAHMRRFAGSRPGGFSVLVVVEQQASPPSAEPRAELVRMFREHTKQILVSGVAMEGQGFRAAMVRSVVTGIAFLIQPTFPLRVFDGLGPATTWMGQAGRDSPQPLDGAGLRLAVQDARAANSTGAFDRAG
jgi:hypothetical protein